MNSAKFASFFGLVIFIFLSFSVGGCHPLSYCCMSQPTFPDGGFFINGEEGKIFFEVSIDYFDDGSGQLTQWRTFYGIYDTGAVFHDLLKFDGHWDVYDPKNRENIVDFDPLIFSKGGWYLRRVENSDQITFTINNIENSYQYPVTRTYGTLFEYFGRYDENYGLPVTVRCNGYYKIFGFAYLNEVTTSIEVVDLSKPFPYPESSIVYPDGELPFALLFDGNKLQYVSFSSNVVKIGNVEFHCDGSYLFSEPSTSFTVNSWKWNKVFFSGNLLLLVGDGNIFVHNLENGQDTEIMYDIEADVNDLLSVNFNDIGIWLIFKENDHIERMVYINSSSDHATSTIFEIPDEYECYAFLANIIYDQEKNQLFLACYNSSYRNVGKEYGDNLKWGWANSVIKLRYDMDEKKVMYSEVFGLDQLKKLMEMISSDVK